MAFVTLYALEMRDATPRPRGRCAWQGYRPPRDSGPASSGAFLDAPPLTLRPDRRTTTMRMRASGRRSEANNSDALTTTWGCRRPGSWLHSEIARPAPTPNGPLLGSSNMKTNVIDHAPVIALLQRISVDKWYAPGGDVDGG